MSRLRATLREWMIRAGLLIGSVAFALLMTEVVLRSFFPLYGGRDNITPDGRQIRNLLEPNVVYRQYSNEYDVLTTITDKGHRVPAADGTPETIFVGDSFTFGWGLADDQVFATIYCQRQHLQCVNLGMPGSGTVRQVARLQEYLEKWNWRPKRVKLFFFGMSSSFSSGNDFNDNYNYSRRLESRARNGANGDPADVGQVPARAGFGGRLMGYQEAILDNLHLMRHAKYLWGPLLRSMVLAVPDEERKTAALQYTRAAFKDLDDLAGRMAFEYQVYLIVPVQDILRGTYPDTLTMLNSVAMKPAESTAPLFLDRPEQYYFSYDGHLNAKGSARLAEFLMSQDGVKAH
jgi:hypothetical protein